MTNLHDRVGILATLDEDQRHRLEVIDKKWVDRFWEKVDNNFEQTMERVPSRWTGFLAHKAFGKTGKTHKNNIEIYVFWHFV